MPIQLPNLDDRRYTDLVEEGKRLIPGLAPSWTDHNPSDPGVTFIELFAFITEMLMYRVDRISEANKLAFVKLLRGPDWKPTSSKPVDAEIRDAMRELRIEERAVTNQDFETLARQADTSVARAYCLPRRNLDATAANAATTDAPGHVSVIIVPTSEQADFPIASEKLRTQVQAELEPRCLLTTRLHVASANFLKVGVSITVQIFADQKEADVKAKVIAALTKYFGPLEGGPKGKGWPFGQTVYVSDLYALLDQVEGVDFVERSGTHPELFVDIPDSVPVARRLPAESFEGLRLEPDELIEFLASKSVISIVRQQAEVSG